MIEWLESMSAIVVLFLFYRSLQAHTKLDKIEKKLSEIHNGIINTQAHTKLNKIEKKLSEIHNRIL